jgi:hypothetical protein
VLLLELEIISLCFFFFPFFNCTIMEFYFDIEVELEL